MGEAKQVPSELLYGLTSVDISKCPAAPHAFVEQRRNQAPAHALRVSVLRQHSPFQVHASAEHSTADYDKLWHRVRFGAIPGRLNYIWCVCKSCSSALSVGLQVSDS